jgi:F0F1-type ATP synthase epsilon subunit
VNSKDSSKASLFLTIRTRQDILFQAEVTAVSSLNGRGPFDILPEHAHFISLIFKQITIHQKDGTQRQIDIDNGILHVEDDKINIYLETHSGF